MLGRFRGLAKLISNRSYLSAPTFNFSSAADEGVNDQNEETDKNAAVKSPTRLKKAAVVLSGSGVYDGSEVTEAVSFLIALSKRKIAFQCYAPNKEQSEVVDHTTGKTIDTKRNVLVESARIARGKVKDLKELQASEYDAVFFPGGFGAAKNLSNFASKGADATVDSDVERVLREFHANKRAIGLACISPVLAAKVLSGDNAKLTLTLGNKGDKWPYGGTIDVVEQLGCRHSNKQVSGTCTDARNLVFTTPAFMKDTTDFSEIFEGIDKMVGTVEEHLKKQKAVEAEKKRAKREKKREAKARKQAEKAAKKAEKNAQGNANESETAEK